MFLLSLGAIQVLRNTMGAGVYGLVQISITEVYAWPNVVSVTRG